MDMHHAAEMALAHVDGVGVGQVGSDPARPVGIIANLKRHLSHWPVKPGVLSVWMDMQLMATVHVNSCPNTVASMDALTAPMQDC